MVRPASKFEFSMPPRGRDETISIDMKHFTFKHETFHATLCVLFIAHDRNERFLMCLQQPETSSKSVSNS